MKKKKTREELKSYLFSHPLFPVINKNFPNRNLDLEFEVMMEHHASGACKCHKGGGQPVNIVAAWRNWIPYTKPDPDIKAANDKAWQEEKDRKMNIDRNAPPSEEGLKKLAELRAKWSRPGSILEKK